MGPVYAAPTAASPGTAQEVQPLWRIDGACAAPRGGRSVNPQQLQRAVDLRRQRLHLRHIARLLRAPSSTVARVLSRLGLGQLRNLEPEPPVHRYEWQQPGDLIHVDVKSLDRFRQVGHRITGDRQQGRSYGVGYDKRSTLPSPMPPGSRTWRCWPICRSQR